MIIINYNNMINFKGSKKNNNFSKDVYNNIFLIDRK